MNKMANICCKLLFSLYFSFSVAFSEAGVDIVPRNAMNNTNGRIIGYLPGWKTPPDASSIANAGYTHIIVAFGVFSTSTPGQIVPAFGSVSAQYIKSLKQAGIKVLISLGGASSSISNTSVDFHQVLSSSVSSDEFIKVNIASIEGLMAQYAFDGVDFDIESGINAEGTFTAPTGDIATLALIINQLHAKHPTWLLTLAPQVANISATSGFDATWGNYASLVMQTYASLEWVGIQLYNSGCAYGIDLVCYDPMRTQSPDFSVAMATDLLANWPSKDSKGRATGFQHYISYLKPSQVILGYPAYNAQGVSDGMPPVVISTVKRAIQCLRTGIAGDKSCDTYVPPKPAPGLGGVFVWELTYDQDAGYSFAKGLRDCVINLRCD